MSTRQHYYDRHHGPRTRSGAALAMFVTFGLLAYLVWSVVAG